ncbi:MAG: FAD-binding protein, partial [Lachnospiraceae bacterium]|nr:FAD-binding protein [Lachnospiraceae bacterium]
RDAMVKNIEVFKRFGIDVTTQVMEAAPEMYEHGGTPTISSNMMSEDIEGVFFVRGSGVAGSPGGSCVTLLHRFGSYATRCALDYLKTKPEVPEVDWTRVEKEFERLHEIKNREVEGGLRPWEVRRHIQMACDTSLGLYRETAAMEASLAELRRIRAEELPKMVTGDKSMIYNTEWKEAIENYNLMEIAEISVQASLMREETRGAYLRAEFPDRDDENWKCTLVAREKDGQIVFEKKTWPDCEEWKQA